MTTWTCLRPDCEAAGEDTWAAADKAAEHHTRDEKHGTSVTTVGSTRVRETDGRVRNVRAGMGT